MNKKFLSAFIFSILLCFPRRVFAMILSDPVLNYSLDVPEAYELAAADDNGNSLLFTHPNMNVQIVTKVFTVADTSSKEILEISMNKLNADASYDGVTWCGSDCTISFYEMTLDKKNKGRGVCAPLSKKDSYLVVLAFVPEDEFDLYQSFIISILNSLSVDDVTLQNPGVFVTYAFPKSGDKKINLEIGGQKINSVIDKNDEEANQYIVELEYGVLLAYANHPLWKEAWQRYYRLIFRDSYGRLSRVADDVYASLYPISKKENPASPRTALLTTLLSWTQGFEYKRAEEKTDTDFTPPVSAILGVGNDCDSRSMLLCCLMQHYGVDSIMLISREYSHAMCAFDIPEALGQKFDTEYGSYIMCETTANVTPGIIAQDHADRSKWIIVD